jgi:2-phosphosulfolactate phosphatase
MEVKILQLLEGAKDATGLTVIIDVFRAFSTACYVYDHGAVKIIPIGEIDQAIQAEGR